MTVLLFARLRDLVGADRIEIGDVATVGELRRALIAKHPSISGLLEKCAVAVNDEFAEGDAAIPPAAEVALLPPVSGG